MNEEMERMMELEGGYNPLGDDPNAPIAVPSQGEMVEMDPTALAAEGIAFAGNYMAKNGPIQPIHRLRDRARGLDENKMTKAQLEEQKMNEAQGYPSNLDEAAKVKELEGKVSNIEAGIGAILQHLQGGQSSPASTQPPAETGGNPVSLAVSPTPPQPPTVTPPSPSLIEEPESPEQESKQPKLREVTLRDGRKVTLPPAPSLGPATEHTAPPQQEEEIVEEPDAVEDDWDEQIVVVPEPEAPKADPKVEKVMHLVQEVNEFLQANDSHRFFVRHLGRHVHRHVGYHGWPQAMQGEFDARFKGFLSDPQFVSSICRKVIDMDMGHALGVKHVVSLLCATAGFTAFALIGLDN
jgi:hypothetical protein